MARYLRFVMAMTLSCLTVMGPSSVVQGQELVEQDGPQKLGPLIAQFKDEWNRTGWNQPPGGRQYLRALNDESWKARMAVLQAAAGGDQETVRLLVGALADDDVGTRVLAAQALGYTSGELPISPLIQQIQQDESTAVQLYLIDALAMQGVPDIAQRLGSWQPTNVDVRKHLNYAKERNGAKIETSIVETLRNFDVSQCGTAVVGEPAPEFKLQALNGETISLEDFRNKQAIVLVFIYGDT